MSTLLSPERTTTSRGFWWRFALGPGVVVVVSPGTAWHHIPFGSAQCLCAGSGFGVVRWVVGWSLVENCTVDASIFVVKLSRANGGCLGTRSR